MKSLPEALNDHGQMDADDFLQQVYQRLFDHFGSRNWWPARTPFEMAVGAILTQNTSWTNVEKAIDNLRAAEALEVETLHALQVEELQRLIYPAGFFRQKSERLQLFTTHLLQFHRGSLLNLLAQPLDQARCELLTLKGIGPETADSILLYAGNHPSFVVDAYTRRLLERLQWLPADGHYEQMRFLFMTHLPAEPLLYNEYHALIVVLCKDYCRKSKPRCATCPLLPLCPTGAENCQAGSN